MATEGPDSVVTTSRPRDIKPIIIWVVVGIVAVMMLIVFPLMAHKPLLPPPPVKAVPAAAPNAPPSDVAMKVVALIHDHPGEWIASSSGIDNRERRIMIRYGRLFEITDPGFDCRSLSVVVDGEDMPGFGDNFTTGPNASQKAVCAEVIKWNADTSGSRAQIKEKDTNKAVERLMHES